jgi:molybdenum cofactor synthesis domain-containing protein
MNEEARTGRQVAIIVVGDEVLAGDVPENNATYLSREITRLGSAVGTIVVLPDREEVIAGELARLAREHDAILVTGGIGLTHDDVTRQAVARWAGVPLAVHPEALAHVRAHYGARSNPRREGLAMLPRDARIIPNPAGAGPGFVTGKAYVFPGVPVMLKAMFPVVAPEFAGTREAVGEVVTPHAESTFADRLALIALRHPETHIGSYPILDQGPFHVRLVAKAPDQARLTPVLAELRRMVEALDDRTED